MAEWRDYPEDAWAEAERLEAALICKRLGWSRRRLNNELNRVASPEAFLERLRRALAELDPPRLLNRDPAKPPTHIPALAAQGEPEMISKEAERDLVTTNNAKDSSRAEARVQARQQHSLPKRLALVESDAKRRGVNINAGLSDIRRVVGQLERRVDRAA